MQDDSRQVTAVTVTYGDRRHFLEQVVAAALEQGVARLVVVNNGAHWDVHGLQDTFGADRIDLVDMGRNTGSAAGFAAGITRALDAGAEFIWLLDDDNRTEPGTLGTLLATYVRLRERHAADKLAVLAFRPEHQADVAMGVPAQRINPRQSSFRGFHVLDIPYKFWRRTPWGHPRVSGTLPETVALDVAPYSGLLFHRTVAESIGLPREDFVLYADDTEFTYRLTRAGGHIALVTGAPIEDLESSWNVRQAQGSSFGVLLGQGSDFRAYYSARNQAYFETHCRTCNGVMFALNRGVYLALLTALAVIQGRRQRLTLVLQAERDGRAARLGPNSRFPL